MDLAGALLISFHPQESQPENIFLAAKEPDNFVCKINFSQSVLMHFCCSLHCFLQKKLLAHNKFQQAGSPMQKGGAPYA